MMRSLAAVLLPALLAASAAAAAPAPSSQGGNTTGDPGRGAAIYERCQACHSLERNRTGSRHCGLLGRQAGAVADFRGYSERKSVVEGKSVSVRLDHCCRSIIKNKKKTY